MQVSSRGLYPSPWARAVCGWASSQEGPEKLKQGRGLMSVIILGWNSSSRLNIYWQTVFPVLKSPTLRAKAWARLHMSKLWVLSRITVQNKMKADFLLQGSSLAWIYCNSFFEWILNWIFFRFLWLEIIVVPTERNFKTFLIKVKTFVYTFSTYLHLSIYKLYACTVYYIKFTL